MKKYARHIFTLAIYWLGINLYWCLWYLGSEGEAKQWSVGEITFQKVCLALNITVFTSYYLLILSRKLSKRWILLSPVSNRMDFLLDCLLTVVGFTGSYFLVLNLFNAWQTAEVLTYVYSTRFLSLMLYHFVLALIVISALNLHKRFYSPSRILAYLGKKPNHPRQVRMGFLFIDLNNSTGIAEKLKNGSYSTFLRMCFHTLDEVLEKNRGLEIYQYVGDEVIIFWDLNQIKLARQAVNLFEQFKRRLNEQREDFLSKYNEIPIFKAAIHGGLVTQAELGKRHLHNAFHGDVLNAASRMLDLCHTHETDLLISEKLYNHLVDGSALPDFEEVKDVLLDGKMQRITLFKPAVAEEIPLWTQKQIEGFI